MLLLSTWPRLAPMRLARAGRLQLVLAVSRTIVLVGLILTPNPTAGGKLSRYHFSAIGKRAGHAKDGSVSLQPVTTVSHLSMIQGHGHGKYPSD